MSDHIPFDIQKEIIKRLPIKSLIQFRSVSKPWKSFIESSKFVTNYHHSQTQHHLHVSYIDQKNKQKYVSIVDDNTFPRQKFSHTLPSSLILPKLVGSSQGLVCFCEGYYEIPDDSGTKRAVIWNPTIRKSVTISVPNVIASSYTTVFGFGVTPDTCDPKLVKVSFDRNLAKWRNITIVEVFTLSTKAWKRLTTNLPRHTIGFEDNHVVIDRFIYWCVYDLRHEDDRLRYHGFEYIMSFDMINEDFKELDISDSIKPYHHLFISKVRESLVVVQVEVVNCGVIKAVSVWMMEHGDPKSLTKKFNINTSNVSNVVCGFRKSGEPVIEMIGDYPKCELFVYEPYSGQRISIGITATSSCNVSSCIETLLLLDH